jgi:hypothetical protein
MVRFFWHRLSLIFPNKILASNFPPLTEFKTRQNSPSKFPKFFEFALPNKFFPKFHYPKKLPPNNPPLKKKFLGSNSSPSHKKNPIISAKIIALLKNRAIASSKAIPMGPNGSSEFDQDSDQSDDDAGSIDGFDLGSSKICGFDQMKKSLLGKVSNE